MSNHLLHIAAITTSYYSFHYYLLLHSLLLITINIALHYCQLLLPVTKGNSYCSLLHSEVMLLFPFHYHLLLWMLLHLSQFYMLPPLLPIRSHCQPANLQMIVTQWPARPGPTWAPSPSHWHCWLRL